MIHKTLAFPLLVLMGSLFAEDSSHILFDFAGTDAAKQWQTVNDDVMSCVERKLGTVLPGRSVFTAGEA